MIETIDWRMPVRIEKATIPTIPKAGRRDPDRTLIQNIVTVDGGIVRARNVTTWDEGGYPISGNRDEIGNRADLLAVLKFMGSMGEFGVKGAHIQKWTGATAAPLF